MWVCACVSVERDKSLKEAVEDKAGNTSVSSRCCCVFFFPPAPGFSRLLKLPGHFLNFFYNAWIRVPVNKIITFRWTTLTQRLSLTPHIRLFGRANILKMLGSENTFGILANLSSDQLSEDSTKERWPRRIPLPVHIYSFSLYIFIDICKGFPPGSSRLVGGWVDGQEFGDTVVTEHRNQVGGESAEIPQTDGN